MAVWSGDLPSPLMAIFFSLSQGGSSVADLLFIIFSHRFLFISGGLPTLRDSGFRGYLNLEFYQVTLSK